MAGTIELTTATKAIDNNLLGRISILKYPRRTRVAGIISSAFLIVLWIASAPVKPIGDIRIVTADLPNPEERLVSLTLINRIAEDEARALGLSEEVAEFLNNNLARINLLLDETSMALLHSRQNAVTVEEYLQIFDKQAEKAGFAINETELREAVEKALREGEAVQF